MHVGSVDVEASSTSLLTHVRLESLSSIVEALVTLRGCNLFFEIWRTKRFMTIPQTTVPTISQAKLIHLSVNHVYRKIAGHFYKWIEFYQLRANDVVE